MFEGIKALVISPEIRTKLDVKHHVSQREIEQAFANITGSFAIENRPQHRTDPPTRWFVADANDGRALKVMFVFEHGKFYIKSAYDATDEVAAMYRRKYGAPQGE